jgi:hypothetical protein
VAPLVAIRGWKRVFWFFLSYKPSNFPIKFSQTPMATKSKMATKLSLPIENGDETFVANRKWRRKVFVAIFSRENGDESFRSHFRFRV